MEIKKEKEVSEITTFNVVKKQMMAVDNGINYYEFPLQNLVNFIVQSRVEIVVEKRFLCSFSSTFEEWICHLWLLRVSYVASDALTCGI